MKKDQALISIAVDGPVSSGKSTLCAALSRRLNILHLDTGAMYRAIGLYALQNGISIEDEQRLAQEIESGKIQVDVRYENGLQDTLLGGVSVNPLLRDEAVGAAASAVSRFVPVRRYLVSLQQKLARTRSILVDGRDIGTVVLPDATLKIFLTASPEARALRRYTQLISAGVKVDYPTVLQDLLARDKQDTQRAVDPLRAAEDAIVLDTSAMSFEESLQKMLELVEQRREEV